MPEIPDITIYIEQLRRRIEGTRFGALKIRSPFILRSVDPPVTAVEGKIVVSIFRLGKQIVWELEDNLFLVIHLMIAGRLHWKPVGAKTGGKIVCAVFTFQEGVLLLTEASTKKRASISLVKGKDALRAFDRGGLEVENAPVSEFRAALLRENHTLKRSLTDPRLFAGIGNAYSDEILHRARLSPLKLTSKLTEEEIFRLHKATIDTLEEWTGRLRKETGVSFPEKVTAFRPEMAVHGKFGQSCPVCGTNVQRIAYAENECDYCPRCQTGGKVLADRSLSRLLKDDWPRTIEELEGKPGLGGSV
jgi:formamidopyrimidine-DNA glycosylase